MPKMIFMGLESRSLVNLNIKFHYFNRLFDIADQVILFLHRFSVFSLSISLTIFCCSQKVGVCRPLPLYYYLGGMPPSTKFVWEPVSLAGTIVLIATVLTMQICIEWKKYGGRKLDQGSKLLSKLCCLHWQSCSLWLDLSHFGSTCRQLGKYHSFEKCWFVKMQIHFVPQITVYKT